MLVMDHDRVGARRAVADVAGGGPRAAEADFLVTPSSIEPSAKDVQLVRATQLVGR
jgi:hypothetical protein